MDNLYPTMDSFLNEFPHLKDYILECESAGEQITHLNIVIANIRHILGWPTINQPYNRYIVVDLQHHTNMHELSKVKTNSILVILLKCMAYILWVVMDDAVHSETLIEDESIKIDFAHIKQSILKYGTQ